MQVVHDHLWELLLWIMVSSPKEETNGDIIPALLTSDGLEGANGETIEASTLKL